MLDHLSFSAKKLFLIDAIGAVVSAFFLGIVLIRLNELVGMPVATLKLLAVIPCFFMVYSFGCYFLLKRNHPTFLRIIAMANLLYCFLTMGLLVKHFEELTSLGFFYFVVEILIILVLVYFEFKTDSRITAQVEDWFYCSLRVFAYL